MQIIVRALRIARGNDNPKRNEDNNRESRTAQIMRIEEDQRMVRCIRAMYVMLPEGHGPLCLDCSEEPPYTMVQYYHESHQLVTYEPNYTGWRSDTRASVAAEQ